VVWVHEVAVELPGEPGEHRMVQSIMLDITELKRAEQALSDERDVFEALMDRLPGIFLFYDTDDRR
jgi:PAS domain-containing protein